MRGRRRERLGSRVGTRYKPAIRRLSRTAVRWGPQFSSSAPPRSPLLPSIIFPLGPPSCGDECRAERALGCGRIFPCGQQAGATGEEAAEGRKCDGGAMGTKSTRDTRLDREVAIKVLPVGFARDPERLRRFQQEAQAAAALNHPNILAVHDFGEHEGSPYMVTEFLEGETLRERLRPGTLPVRKATEYAEQVARGLAAAHEKGIVHRDLKPENIFVTRDGRVKILDFGLAKLTRPEGTVPSDAATPASQTEPGMVMGTVGYMSPEQVKGQNADHRSDLYSFGAILYEMLSEIGRAHV